MHTDKEIKANRPDIIVKDKNTNICTFIEMSVPSERNVSTKEVEKISKYKDLEIEVSKMWNMKTITVPVVIGALGLVRKSLSQHVKKIPGLINVEPQNIDGVGRKYIRVLGSVAVRLRPILNIFSPN